MKKFKHILTLITVLTLITALGITSFAAKTYPDVPTSGVWYSEAVYAVSDLGWMGGYSSGKFGPSDTLQRQDFVVILASIAHADLSLYKNTQPFDDAVPGKYYTAAVAWAKYNGVASGYENGKFGVGDTITREQLCTIIYRFVVDYLRLGFLNYADSGKFDSFPDVAKVSAWAVEGMRWAVNMKYVSGEGGKYLAPQTNAFRAQTAQILYSARNELLDTSNARTPVDPTLEYKDAALVLEGINKSGEWHTGNTSIGDSDAGAMTGISVTLINAPDSGAACSAYFSGNGWTDKAYDGARNYIDTSAIKAVTYELTGKVREFYDIYYRCYSSAYGWLGWSKNGEKAGVNGVDSQVLTIEFCLVKKGESAPGVTDGAYLSKDVTFYVGGKAYLPSIGWREKTSGTVVGSTEDRHMQAIALTAPNNTYSGISYRVYIKDTGFTSWYSDGAQAGTIGKEIEAIEIKTSGFIAEVFNVYYRVKIDHVGFSGWAKNGESAGSKGGGLAISQVDIRLVPKDKAAPGDTANRFRQYDAVDRKAINALNSCGWTLRQAFDWTVDFNYVTMTTDLSKGVNYFADYGFDHKSGNCYVYAACFFKMAKILGYDAHWTCGYIQTKSGKQNHGWVEIDQGGSVRVYDPECMSKYPSINAYNFTYGTKGTWRYVDYQRMA